MDTPIGARESVGINALMTPIFKRSKPMHRNSLMTPTFNAGKSVNMKKLRKRIFGRRALVGAAQYFKKKAEGRDRMSVCKATYHEDINNLMTPVFGCGVSVRAAPAFKKKSKANNGMISKPPNRGWGRKRSFTSTVNPSSSTILGTTFATPKTQKMDMDFPTGESTFPRNERSVGLTWELPGRGEVGTNAGDMYQTAFKKPTTRRNANFTSLQKFGDKELGVSLKQDVKIPATPDRMVVCPPAGAPKHKQLFINIGNHKPFPRSDASLGIA